MSAPEAPGGFPPICVIYSHLHDSIRAELDTLAAAVLALQQAGTASGGAGLGEGLRALRERYRFLEQVYKYHSSVEDEASAGRCWCPAGGGGGGGGRRHAPLLTVSAPPFTNDRLSILRWTPKCETSRWRIRWSTKMRSICLSRCGRRRGAWTIEWNECGE